MRKKEKIMLGLMLIFLFTLFFPRPVIVTILAPVALIICTFFFNSFKEKWELLKQRRYLQVMFLFFGAVVVSVFLSSDFKQALKFLDSRIALFYLPLTIGTLYLSKQFRNTLLLLFAVLTTAMCMVCLGYGLHRSAFFEKPEFLYNDALTQVLGQQSIYIALLVNLSIYIFGYFLFFKKVKYKVALVLAMLFLFVMSYLLASRIMMGTLFVVCTGFCFYYILQRKKYVQGVALLAALLVGGLLIYQLFPQTMNRFKELTYTQFDYQSMGKESHYNMEVTADQWNGANLRMAAWRCGWELFKQHPVFGVHIGDKKTKLFEMYAQKGFQFGIANNKNVHSNFLDILYSLGLIGFALFLTGWIVLPIVTAWKQQDGLAILVIATFAAAWITEIYFDRNLGGMLTGFFIPFLLTYIEKGSSTHSTPEIQKKEA